MDQIKTLFGMFAIVGNINLYGSIDENYESFHCEQVNERYKERNLKCYVFSLCEVQHLKYNML
jgi:hypothetical protein